MKKCICLCLSVVLCLSLAACGKSAKTPDSQSTNADSDTNAAANTYTESWVIKPSVQAEMIDPLPLIHYNEDTHHYEISFGDVYRCKINGKFGLINSSAQMVVPAEYDSIETCVCTDNKYILTRTDADGDTATYTMSPATFTTTWSEQHSAHASFSGYRYYWDADAAAVKSVYFYSDENSQTSVRTVFVPETAEVISNGAPQGTYTVIAGGKAVGSSDYTAAGVFTDGLAAMQKNGKWGYVNAEGETVIPFEYDAVSGYNVLGSTQGDTPYECCEGYVTVCKNAKYGVMSADGTLVVPCQYRYLTTVRDGRAFASTDGKTWGVLCIDQNLSDGVRTTTTSTTVNTEN